MSEKLRKISNFHLTRTLHEGVKSEIYEARYTQLGGVVQSAAVKLLKPWMACIGDELRAFLRELGWARDLGNPVAPRVLEAGERDGNYFLAMEYIEGWTVAELLRSLAVLQVSLPAQVGLTIVHQIAEGVQQMHAYAEAGQPVGVVHLGIQPDNIILRKTGATMLVDFGMTTTEGSDEVIEFDGPGGAYQAPEHLRMLPVDCRADVYSLGRVLGDLAQSMAPDQIGEDLPALLARACHVHAEERFASMAEFIVAIELVASNRGVQPSVAACKDFAAEIFGKSEGKSDPRARRPQSVPPMVMQSEGLATAFAHTIEPERDEQDSLRSTVMGGPDAPDLRSTVMGGPDVMATTPGGPDLRFGEPEFGNEEPTERNMSPHASGEEQEAPEPRARFVDQHKAVTVMGAPQMLADLASSEETTAVLEEQARAGQGFPEELIATISYASSAAADGQSEKPSDEVEGDDDETTKSG